MLVIVVISVTVYKSVLQLFLYISLQSHLLNMVYELYQFCRLLICTQRSQLHYTITKQVLCIEMYTQNTQCTLHVLLMFTVLHNVQRKWRSCSLLLSWMVDNQHTILYIPYTVDQYVLCIFSMQQLWTLSTATSAGLLHLIFTHLFLSLLGALHYLNHTNNLTPLFTTQILTQTIISSTKYKH